jgi:hypothetical protein
MNQLEPGPPQTPTRDREPVLFAENNSDNGAAGNPDRSWMPWIVALVVICFGLGAMYWFGRPADNSGTGVDPYAKKMVLSNVQVSRASNFAGDQLTYVDGRIENHGNRIVTSMTLQASFPDETGDPPQILQAAVNLIRSRDANRDADHVDMQPMSVAPLGAGESKEFRLVFDNVAATWNQQPPSLQIVDISTRP